MKVYDATDTILGRLATTAAKQALLGETVKIVNSEKAIVSGSRENVLAKFKAQRDRGGPVNGPFLPRMPDRFVRRSIRGMLPYKQQRGREAYNRILCYLGVPDEFKKEKLISLKAAGKSKLPTLKYITIQEICRSLGGKL